MTENANMAYSLPALNHYLPDEMSEHYWLESSNRPLGRRCLRGAPACVQPDQELPYLRDFTLCRDQMISA